MSLSPIEKIKIGKVLRETPLSKISYYDFFDNINKKSKYTDVEVLEYLLDFVYDTFLNNKKITSKLLEKYIYSIKMFVQTIVEDKKYTLSDNTISKLQVLKSKYNEYVKNVSDEINEDILKELSEILKTCNVSEEIDVEILDKHLSEITALEKEIKNLSKIVSSQQNEIELLKKQNEALKKENQDVCALRTSQLTQINWNEQQIALLNKQLEEALNEIKILTEKLEELKSTNSGLDAKEKIINDLQETINTQQGIITRFEEKENNNQLNIDLKQKIERLASFIYTVIATEERSAVQILVACKNAGFEVGIEEVKEALRYLGNTFRINDEKRISIPEMYKIIKPNYNTNVILNLPPSQKDYLDILLISDPHFKFADINSLCEMEKVLDYCKKEGIELILDLGDFLGIHEDMTSKSEYDCYLEYFVEKFPTDERVVHAILGGNHDKNALCCGADLLKNICVNKDGLLFLGYDSASVMPGKKLNNSLGLYHKDKKIMTDLTDGIFPNDHYINFIGHNHASKFDIMNQNILVPSLLKDRVMNGAIKLRVYLDKNKDINYILCTLLQNTNKLIPITEVPYQKTRNK